MAARRAQLTLLVLGALAGCAASGLEGGVYRGDGFAFRVAPPQDGWRPVEHSHAALAYHDASRRSSMLVNARCGADGEDVPLLALTNHLFLDFTERTVRSQEVVPFDGREAMHTVMSAKLDGVPMTFDVWVLKKDGCVYDLLYAAPESNFERGLPAFRYLVDSFATVESDD